MEQIISLSIFEKQKKIKISNDYVHFVLIQNNKTIPNAKKQKRSKPWVSIKNLGL